MYFSYIPLKLNACVECVGSLQSNVCCDRILSKQESIQLQSPYFFGYHSHRIIAVIWIQPSTYSTDIVKGGACFSACVEVTSFSHYTESVYFKTMRVGV